MMVKNEKHVNHNQVFRIPGFIIEWSLLLLDDAKLHHIKSKDLLAEVHL